MKYIFLLALVIAVVLVVPPALFKAFDPVEAVTLLVYSFVAAFVGVLLGPALNGKS